MALSMYNPHAILMALGKKRIETRHWMISYRGPMAIYATLKFPEDHREMCIEEPCKSILREAGFYTDRDLPRGVIVGMVTAVECRWINDEDNLRIPNNWEGIERGDAFYYSPEYAFGNYAEKRTMLYTRNPVRLTRPVGCRPPGQTALWPVPAEVEREIRLRMQEPEPEPPHVPEGKLF